MSENTEAGTIAMLATQSVEAKPVFAGEIYTVPDGAGGLAIVDTDKYSEAPRRKAANRVVHDARSFVGYLDKHALADQTEVFADKTQSSVVAIIDSHRGATEPAGHEKHTLTLKLEMTKSWLDWTKHDGYLFNQAEFAEFIEQHATDVFVPAAGELMSMAQTFYMTSNLEFESTSRLSDGQTELVYKEKLETKGLGKTEIPKELDLALQPYVGGPRSHCFASLRTRLSGSTLKIGYVLIRPEEILEGIFADIVTEIKDGKAESPVGPAFDGIQAPIYFGRPAKQ